MKLSNIKFMTVALSLSAFFPVYANVQIDENKKLSDANARMLFNDPQILSEIQVLSADEMRSTEGAINPFVAGAAAGAAINGIKYGIGVGFDKDRSFDKAELGKTMAAGAGIGALTGPAAAAAGGGLSVGANVWRFNGAAANYGADKAMNSHGSNHNNGRPAR